MKTLCLVVLVFILATGLTVAQQSEVVPEGCEEMSIKYQLTIRDLNKTLQTYKDDVTKNVLANIKTQKAKDNEKVLD